MRRGRPKRGNLKLLWVCVVNNNNYYFRASGGCFRIYELMVSSRNSMFPLGPSPSSIPQGGPLYLVREYLQPAAAAVHSITLSSLSPEILYHHCRHQGGGPVAGSSRILLVAIEKRGKLNSWARRQIINSKYENAFFKICQIYKWKKHVFANYSSA